MRKNGKIIQVFIGQRPKHVKGFQPAKQSSFGGVCKRLMKEQRDWRWEIEITCVKFPVVTE